MCLSPTYLYHIAMDAAAFLAIAGMGVVWGLATRRGEERRAEERKDIILASNKPVKQAYLPGAPQSKLAFYKVNHMRDFFPDLKAYESPLLKRTWPLNHNFTEESDFILASQSVVLDPKASPASIPGPRPHLRRTSSEGSIDVAGRATEERSGEDSSADTESPAYAAAGPSRHIIYDPKTVRVAIATCGGLCPGLNTVIRELVMCLTYVYGVPRGQIFGVPNGYRGFYTNTDAWTPLVPDEVSRIHTMGGTVLGSSRGGMDPTKILDALVEKDINIVILIGGDGTHRGADLLFRQACARNVPISVACVPKTIDNDIGIIDRSFGFQTAVEQAVRPIDCAHTEALSAKGGIGLVKLMGREAGFIALYATLASRDVNVILIPEAPWRLSKLLAYLEERLIKSTHAVVVVAEGAESEEMKEARAAGHAAVKTDESGNRILDDVGEYLKAGIIDHFKRKGKVCNLKYIDPSYIIRSSPANAADSDLCTLLAYNCVHGAMAGRTGFTVGTIDNVGVWLPVTSIANGKPRRVEVNSRLYARSCSSTGQPSLE